MTELKNIVKNFEEKEKNLIEITKIQCLTAIQQLFTDYPALKSFSFNCYTPSWNDGDNCVNTVDYYAISINGAKLTKEGYYEYNEETEKLATTISKLLQQIPASLFEKMFGTDIKITVTKEGYTIENYDY